VTFVEWATLASVLASLVLVALTVRAIVRRERKLTPVAAFFLLLVLGILINAAICGAFSTPRGRYQMRLIWVLPLAALATGRVRIGRSEVPGASAGAAAAA
jgi:glucan phosphoethanolaminetransferase (alkaline phosphatase superfamily)